MCIMLISGLSVLCTIIVLSVRHTDPTHQAPVWLRQLALHEITRLLCMGRRGDDQAIDESLCSYYRSRGSNVSASQIWNASILNSQLSDTHSQQIRLSPEGHVNDMFFDGVSIRHAPDTIFSISGEKHHQHQQHFGNRTTSATSLGVNADQRMGDAGCKNAAGTESVDGNSSAVKIEITAAVQNNNNSDNADKRQQALLRRRSSTAVYHNALEWHAIARVLDRLFFVIFLTATISFTAGLGFVFAFCPPTEIDVIAVS